MMKIKLVLLSLFFGIQLFLHAQSSENKMAFSSQPFYKKTVEQHMFKMGSSIYCRLTLDKPLKSYSQKIHQYELDKFKISGIYTDFVAFQICPVGEDPTRRSNVEIKLYLKPVDLEKSTIDFDIMPSSNDASTFFGNFFYEELASSSAMYSYFGKKIEININLVEPSKNYDLPVQINVGSIIIDHTDTNYENLAEWKEQCGIIGDSIQSLYNK